MTPIAERLRLALDEEYRWMQNQWFFKWHFIGREGPVEIDAFDGSIMKFGFVGYFGTNELLYWETIQRYLNRKVGWTFDQLERELRLYPLSSRRRALTEVSNIIVEFVGKIRKTSIETDRVLRGNGFEIPEPRNLGSWEGSRLSDIKSRIEALSQIYCHGESRWKAKMPYQANVLRVMIASPSDVAAEREIVRSVIYEWNAVNSDDRKVVLMPVGWESHSSPAMGDRPQGIINKQVLQNCDLLIAVFWTKLGTPTGKAKSGTVEEIEEHLSAGKPALIYFSAEPVALDSVDPDQFRYLKEFERSMMSRGLIEKYESKIEFREKLNRQLSQTIIREFSSTANFGEPPYPTERIESITVPSLKITDAGRDLLTEAVKDKNGIIMKLETMSGTDIRTNQRQFVEGGDSRSVALWRSAVNELERIGLIEDRGGKGEVFFVTREGFEAADQLL